MMKTILILCAFFAVALLSCSDEVQPTEELNPRLTWTTLKSGFIDLSIVRIDECEYILYKTGYGCAITHKADCKNKIHQQARGK